jgi:AhpD family alkylhydroperoxidase
MAWVRVADSANEQNLPILYDPQTSGGLLISLPEEAAKQLIAAMHARGHSATSMIGRVKARETGQAEGGVIVTNTRLMNLVGRRGVLRGAAVESGPWKTVSREMPMDTNKEETRCCDGSGAAAIDKALATPDRYQTFLKQANQPGLIDARSKKLMAIALSVAQRCEPCLKGHLKSALAMGITPAEIDEAAWLAIAFAGSPAMMLYREASREMH